ncbi:MAG: N-acetylmuramoyl-L-alanine amidase [Fimbriimonas sp.]
MKHFGYGRAAVIGFLVLQGLACTRFGPELKSPVLDPVHWLTPEGRVDWEAEKVQRRIKTDTIVFHHTALPPGTTWKQLSDIHRETLYVPRFLSNEPDPFVKGLPIQSNHFRVVGHRKVEVFYAYHWLVRADGSAEKLLKDEEVGWHSGSWKMNMRSLAICLDGDFQLKPPTRKAIETCRRLVKKYQKRLGRAISVLGHSDVTSTECPGSWFRRVFP